MNAKICFLLFVTIANTTHIMYGPLKKNNVNYFSIQNSIELSEKTLKYDEHTNNNNNISPDFCNQSSISFSDESTSTESQTDTFRCIQGILFCLFCPFKKPKNKY